MFSNLLQANKVGVKGKETSNPHTAITGSTGNGKSCLLYTSDYGKYEQLVNEDRLSAYVEEHEEEIASRISESYTYLGHEGDSWYFLK